MVVVFATQELSVQLKTSRNYYLRRARPLVQMEVRYSSGQNKVPTAEWKSRLIVAQ